MSDINFDLLYISNSIETIGRKAEDIDTLSRNLNEQGQRLYTELNFKIDGVNNDLQKANFDLEEIGRILQKNYAIKESYQSQGNSAGVEDIERKNNELCGIRQSVSDWQHYLNGQYSSLYQARENLDDYLKKTTSKLSEHTKKINEIKETALRAKDIAKELARVASFGRNDTKLACNSDTFDKEYNVIKKQIEDVESKMKELFDLNDSLSSIIDDPVIKESGNLLYSLKMRIDNILENLNDKADKLSEASRLSYDYLNCIESL